MINIATNISQTTATSISEALNLPVSVAEKVFKSRAFENWKQSKDVEIKIQNGIADRLNNVIVGIGVLAKIMAKRT